MNGWCDEFSSYERYVDHAYHRMAYIVTPEGATVLGNKPHKHVEIVRDFKELAPLSAAVAECSKVLGGVDCLISLSEFDLMMAAELRALHHIPGDQPHDVARFRDKTVMKNRMLAAGVRAPRFFALDARRSTMDAVYTLRYPVVIKPRCGAASAGVHVAQSRDALDRILSDLPLSEYECEEYIPGPIFHVDGLVCEGKVQFQKASRYLGTCLNFAHGKPLGSITLAPSDFRAELLRFNAQCLRALDLCQCAFHLEIIGSSDGLFFLEAEARVGGGEIPFIMHDIFGVDLYEGWVQQQLDPAFRIHPKNDATLAGFLLIPESAGKRLVEVSVPQKINTLYASVVPPLNHVFDGRGGYDTILGRFRYQGENEGQIETAIYQTLQQFSYRLEDVLPVEESTVYSHSY